MPRKRKEIIKLIQEAHDNRPSILDLSNCNLGDLIEQVGWMNWLTELNLSHCHLNNLPDTIGNLTNLTRLILSENQLATLPVSIINLTALQYLDLNLAGYEFSVSTQIMAWLQAVPKVSWTNNTPPILEPAYVFPAPDHPNRWLEWLKQALSLYGDALSMEDRNFNGSGKREEADTAIEQIFNQLPELKEILPEFYRDFQAHNFYSTSCASEKTLDHNPFRLPTKIDESWLANSAIDPINSPTLRLSDEIPDRSRRHIFTLNPDTGDKSEVFSCEYGRFFISNQPYAADEEYMADCQIWLYQAGSNRYYVRAEIYGYGGIPSTEWLSSNNDGLSWQKQARLTYEWLDNHHKNWPELDYIPRKEE